MAMLWIFHYGPYVVNIWPRTSRTLECHRNPSISWCCPGCSHFNVQVEKQSAIYHVLDVANSEPKKIVYNLHWSFFSLDLFFRAVSHAPWPCAMLLAAAQRLTLKSSMCIADKGALLKQTTAYKFLVPQVDSNGRTLHAVEQIVLIALARLG